MSSPNFSRFLGAKTTAQRNALPVEFQKEGNWIVNMTTGFPQVHNGTAWQNFA